MQFLSFNKYSSMLLLKILRVLACSLSNTVHGGNIELDQIMREVFAYKELKTIENSQTVSAEKWSPSLSGGSRLREVSTVGLRLGKCWCFR